MIAARARAALDDDDAQVRPACAQGESDQASGKAAPAIAMSMDFSAVTAPALTDGKRLGYASSRSGQAS